MGDRRANGETKSGTGEGAIMTYVLWALIVLSFCIVLYGIIRAELNGGEYVLRIGLLEIHFKRRNLP